MGTFVLFTKAHLGLHEPNYLTKLVTLDSVEKQLGKSKWVENSNATSGIF